MAAVLLSEKGFPGKEAVIYHELSELPLSRRRDNAKVIMVDGKRQLVTNSAYTGFGLMDKMLYVALFRRDEDRGCPGNLLLKFEVVYGGEVVDVPQVSWNQEDDLDLIYGDGWLLKLTRHRLVAEAR